MYIILGAGLSGLTIADHLKKKGIPFKIFEGKSHGGGHIYSEQSDGFTWDEGPHVSFAKSDYVKNYFADNCSDKFLEYPTNPSNYYKGNWIPHPAQSHLYAIPEALRTQTLQEIKRVREHQPENYIPANYDQWLQHAFGSAFTTAFPESYTIKYWTTEPANLSTDWIGKRIYFPDVEDMIKSADGPLNKQTHYINKVRYPQTGGFYSFIKSVEASLPIQYNKKLSYISFDKKELQFEDGEIVNYEKLVSTIPLTKMINNSDAPAGIKAQSQKLKCSQLLLVNVIVSHPAPIPNQWIYVYDTNMYSTRISFTNLLSPQNGVEGKAGIQVEVYFSDYRKPAEPIEEIAEKILLELVEMKLVTSKDAIESHHLKWVDFANVIFDNERRQAQEEVLHWLSTKGMARETDDLEPMTNWEEKMEIHQPLGNIILAGRFAQWKYYWTDDCVLRAQFISMHSNNT